MKKEMSVRQIYDDFISKTILTDDEMKVLVMYIKGDSIVKISSELNQSTATISRTIASLKEKYKRYKTLEIAKLILLEESK